MLGRQFDLDLIREVSGRSEEETVTALEELTRRGLLAETGSGELAFCHEQGVTQRKLTVDELFPKEVNVELRI